MKLIFLTGIPQIDRSVMAEIALKRINLPKYELDFADYESNSRFLKSLIQGKNLTMHEISEMIKKIDDEFQKFVIKAMKECEGVLIVSCPLTVSKDFGIYPIISKETFDSFSPDLILLVERPAISITKNEKEIKRIEKHQEINEMYAFSYSAITNAPVNRIMIKGEKLDAAVRTLTMHIKSMRPV